MKPYQYPELQENQHDSGILDNKWFFLYTKEYRVRKGLHVFCHNSYCKMCN